MSAKVSRGAAALQRRWWFSMFTRNRHSGQTRFPRCQYANALTVLRCHSRVTSSSSLGFGSGQIVRLEDHGQVHTLREVRTKKERYVSAASYSQLRDLRESRREIRRG